MIGKLCEGLCPSVFSMYSVSVSHAGSISSKSSLLTFVVQKTAIKIALASPKWDGTGTRANKIAEGRCVNAIVLIFPIRRARDPATMLEIAATNDVVKKVFPRVPSSM